ncbi:oogenesis-related [Engraulis encrasicolus]|uniref:oogenesis-related n=1 Tax=Engraulis encrasicolus TaxID=184585 RepID=UPI002FCEA083
MPTPGWPSSRASRHPRSSMTSEGNIVVVQEETSQSKEVSTPKRAGVVSTALCRISQIWPLRLVMRAFRGFWWFFGFSGPEKPLSPAGVESPTRTCQTGRKRLWRATRILLAVIPGRIRNALGYPVCTSIGRTVCSEVQFSPTKPHGKGSKRKQDDVEDDDDEEEVEQPSWVDALNQELSGEQDPNDPDYEPTSVVTDSEEYCSHNDTESDIEVQDGHAVIKDVNQEAATSDSPDSDDPDCEVLLQDADVGASDAPDSEDPDYEPGNVVTDSEEYCSHNDTGDMSELDVDQGVVVIEDVKAPSGDEQSNGDGYTEFEKGAKDVEKEVAKN